MFHTATAAVLFFIAVPLSSASSVKTYYEDPAFDCNGSDTGVKRNCSSSATRYDSLTDRCLLPEYVTDCKGRPTTTTPVPPTTPRVLDVDFDCSFRRSGDYVHPNKPCSSIFFSCAGGQVYQRQCAGNLRFDPITRLCLAEEFVKPCGGRTTERVIETTTTADIVEGVACDPDRAYFTAHPGNPCSELYIGCEYGIARLLVCPSDLRFDPETTLCLEKPFVLSCGGSPTPIPVFTTTLRDPSLPAVSCQGRTLFTRFTDIKCAPYFLICSLQDGFAEVIFCATGLHYDSQFDRCMTKQFIPECGGVRPPPERMEPPTTIKPDRDAPAGACGAGVTGHISWPGEDCSQYFIICGPLGHPSVFKCQGGLRYDPLYSRCDLPEYIPECGGARTKAPIFVDEQFVPLPPVNFDCSARANGNYPSGDCDPLFYTCSNGIASQTTCPATTVYGSDLDQCVPRRSVGTCPEARAAPSCARADGFYSIYSDCSSYVVCQAYEVLLVQQCDAGLVFHPTRRRCLSPSEVPAPCGSKQEAPEFTCEGRQLDRYYRHEDDCGRYFLCELDGSAWEFECTDGYSFDLTINECRLALDVSDCGAPAPPAPVPDIPDIALFCRFRSGLFPHPSDCRRTIVCLSHIRYVLICPTDKPRFDVEIQDCAAANQSCP